MPKCHDGFTALLYACEKGRTDVAVALLNHDKVDVNAKNKHGYTALALACRKGHTEIVRTFAKHPKITCLDSRFVLASEWGHVEVVRELLIRGKF
jgi:ankyrin repeat protein